MQEVYGGMVTEVQFALENPYKRLSDIYSFAVPIPGYPVKCISDSFIPEGLCDKEDCTNIDAFPF
jgi:hypothetical protein